MDFLEDSKEILAELGTDERWSGSQVVYVSRTNYPEWAVPLLSLMDVSDSQTMDDVGHSDWNQIYPGNKKRHFADIAKKSGYEYKDMVSVPMHETVNFFEPSYVRFTFCFANLT